MNAQGVVAASVPNLLRTVVAESDTWKELRDNIEKAMEKEKPGNITHSAYSFIYQKLADIQLNSRPCTIDLNKDIVLDFSGHQRIRQELLRRAVSKAGMAHHRGQPQTQ